MYICNTPLLLESTLFLTKGATQYFCLFILTIKVTITGWFTTTYISDKFITIFSRPGGKLTTVNVTETKGRSRLAGN